MKIYSFRQRILYGTNYLAQILFANPVAFLRANTLERVLTKFIVNATVFKELRLKVFLLLHNEANGVSY